MKRAFLLAALASLACAPVRPWERDKLAHRCMRPESRATESSVHLHFLGAREGSSGAAGEVGGGCGCR